ncbi:MAG: ribosome-associated translation inhibitor RaiA [Sulfurimonas sp.]|jgi:putative sigma-54 modulation protein|nr:ribosome-associated translation inhibitor RaiA [Sulfurimonadaceae bacterium]
MNISITARHIELSETIKGHINSSLDSLSKYNIEIISATVVVFSENKKGKELRGVEYVLHLAHKNSIVINQKDVDVYAAIDLATERAKKALRRIADRESYRFKDGGNEAKIESAAMLNVNEVSENLDDEIVPLELELYKPREVEDVLNELKESGRLFEIFLDNDGKTRVLYKRNDGRFGLY